MYIFVNWLFTIWFLRSNWFSWNSWSTLTSGKWGKRWKSSFLSGKGWFPPLFDKRTKMLFNLLKIRLYFLLHVPENNNNIQYTNKPFKLQCRVNAPVCVQTPVNDHFLLFKLDKIYLHYSWIYQTTLPVSIAKNVDFQLFNILKIFYWSNWKYHVTWSCIGLKWSFIGAVTLYSYI